MKRRPPRSTLTETLFPYPTLLRSWAARKALSPALRTIAAGKINEDVVVPVSRLPALVAGIEALAREFDLPIVAFGHAGNGNLHANILFDPDDARSEEHTSELQSLKRISYAVFCLKKKKPNNQ